MKRRKQTKKQTRESFDKRLAKAKTRVAQARTKKAKAKAEYAVTQLVLFGRERAPNRAAQLTDQWHSLHAIRAQQSRIPDPQKKLRREVWAAMRETAKTEAAKYMRDAMEFWLPEMLVALAREMKRVKDPTKYQKADAIAYNLLQAEKQGPVNLSETQRRAEQRNEAFADLRTWRRRARNLGVKTRAAGRPKN